MDTFDLMHHLMISCALWGNGYARIYRGKDSRPIRLQLIHPAKVEPILNTNEELFYRLDNGELFPSDELIHLRGLSTNGIKGKSPYNRQNGLYLDLKTNRTIFAEK